MVSSTRSAKKNTDEVVGNSSKKKVVNGKPSNLSPEKTDMMGVRRSARETQSSRLKTPSPQSTRKSERIEKQTTPIVPPMKRNSIRIEKQNLTSPPQRSDRGKKNRSSSSSGTKQSGERLNLLNLKRKENKEKSLKQLAVESGQSEPDVKSVGTKRKKMSSRRYKALFKPQKIKYTTPDVSQVLPRQDNQCQGDSGEIGSEPIGKSKDRSVEVTSLSVDMLENEVGSKLSHHSSPKHDGNCDSPQLPEGDGLKNLKTGCLVIDILDDDDDDDEDEALKNCSLSKNVEVPVLRSIDGLENDKRSIQPEGLVSLSSSGCETHSLLGTCTICSRKKRVNYGSPEEELCSCRATSNMFLDDLSKDRGDPGADIYFESTGRCGSSDNLKESHSDHKTYGPENVCVICSQGGELLRCTGNGCKRFYHPSCLDPPLSDVPPGVWHCLWCVKKKVELGAHSVSRGIESIWNAREVEVSNAEGVERQKQYLVKYHGLAHIHNHWVPEKQLLPETYYLIAEFNSKHQVVKWNSEWTVPHRLLKKRSVIFSRQEDRCRIAPPINISDSWHEWLVKWCGLGYEHASWELDNDLSSPRGQELMKDYEIRLQKAKRTVDKSQKGCYVKLSKLPTGGSLRNNYSVLRQVNKLRSCWYRGQNAVVFDNQEWAMTLIFFILSLSEVCQPFLVIVASDAISLWEAEFSRLAPSIAVTVYSGSRDMRKTIRWLEFYEEGGSVMLQVLLSSPEAAFEDIDILRHMRWEAVIIDECQHSRLENHLEQIKMLPTDSRILLFNGEIKDTVSEYLNLLSLLDSNDDLEKFRGLKSDTIDNLGKLKERLSHFIAYGSIPELSKFVEYWVPVPILNCQLEQYCATLLSKSIALCSCSKSDPVGALRDILFTVRKCCDHPYLVNSTIQEGLIAEGRLAPELLDFGIKACGKLQLLDMILPEIKNQGLQVVILYQPIFGLGGVSSLGNILEDFLQQRFGPNSYERIDAKVTSSKKKLAAVNSFNKKDSGQFVFLLENRACSSSIKLSSVDIVFIYGSEWNPANDLRALQKISFDSKLEEIKVFRLYSSCTVEEKALLVAKQVLNLDNNLQNLSRTTSDTLLRWGASYLFSKLDEYHAESGLTPARRISSEQFLLNDTMKELLVILSETGENNASGCIISRVQLGVGRYNINLSLRGEGKFQLNDGEEAHVFWRKLLEGRNPWWNNSSGSTPRNRKRVQYFDENSRNLDTESDEVGRKRRKVNENVNPTSGQVELKQHQMTQAASSKGGACRILACQTANIHPESNPNVIAGQSSSKAGLDVDRPQERVTSSNEQKSLHKFLKGEMANLCQVLKVSEDVMHMVERFLEYVIKNHHVSNESPTIIQAFQISLFWSTASILKRKVDRKDSLALAKQFLNYGCTEEQADSVYSKMRVLKRLFLLCLENTRESRKDCILSTESVGKEACEEVAGIPQFSALDQLNVKTDIEEGSAKRNPSSDLILSEHKQLQEDYGSKCEIKKRLKKIQKKCDKRIKILLQQQHEEVLAFHKTWEEKRVRLEDQHKLETACIRSIHGLGSLAIDKLKLLDADFAMKMEEHKRLKEMHLKDLEANMLVARNDLRQKAACWLAKAKACHAELKDVNEPCVAGSQSEDKAGCSEVLPHINLSGIGNATSMFEQKVEDTNLNKDSHLVQGNDEVPSNGCNILQAGTVGFTLPTGTADHLVSITSEREMGTSSLARTSIPVTDELPNELVHSSNATHEIASVNLPGSGELASEEITVQASQKLQMEVPEAVPENVAHVQSVERIDVSNVNCDKGDRTNSSLSDDVMNERGRDESIRGSPSSPGQSLLPQAGTAAPSDHSGSLTPSHVPLASSASGGFQDREALILEDQSTSLVDVVISEVNSESPMPSNHHNHPENLSNLRVEVANAERNDSEPPARYNHALAIENHEHLQPIPLEASRSCEQIAATEAEDESRDMERIPHPEISPQLTGETEALPHQVSLSGQDLEQTPPVAPVGSTTDCNQRDLGLVSQVDNVPNGEFTATSQSNVSVTPAVVNSAELSNQVNLQSEVDLSHPRGSSNITAQPFYQAPSNITSQPLYQAPIWYLNPSLHVEPLQNELLRISKEVEKTIKVHEDLKLSLRSECEKEIQEAISQIRNKYEAKVQEAETAFLLKKSELDENHRNVLMNRILAETFRSKCLDLRPSGPPGMQQATPSSFMQQLQQLSISQPMGPVSSVCQPQSTHHLPLPQSTRPAPVNVSSSSCQPQTVAPTAQATHQPSLRHSTTGTNPGFVSSSGSQPASSLHSPVPAVQTVRHTSAGFSGVPTRPLRIGSITPSMGNMRLGEVRSPAPHLQTSRPSTSAPASAASLSSASNGMPSQRVSTHHPATSPSFPQHAQQRAPHSPVSSLPPLPQRLPSPVTNTVSQNRQPESRLLAPHNPPLSAVQLLMDMDQRPRVHGHETLASVPDAAATSGLLGQSGLETLGEVRGSVPSSVATTNVVYLSDED